MIVVYGEDNEDREISWCARAEKSFQLLNHYLTSIGANPDLLIPDDAFNDIDVSSKKNSSKDVIDLTGDCLSDEEMALFFPNNDIVHEID